MFKFVTILVLEFKKVESDDETKYSTFYSSSKAKRTINKSDINDLFESIYSTNTSNIQNSLGSGSGWIIDSVVDDTNNNSKYKVVAVISNYGNN